MRFTEDDMESGARDKVREWIGSGGRVLHVWQYDETYYVVAQVEGAFEPSLKFLRVWYIPESWALSQDGTHDLPALPDMARPLYEVK